MVVLDADIVTDRVPVAFDEGIRFSPVSRPECQPVDPRALYERDRARADREQARADTAEARCEELRWAEVAARSDAGSWKSQFRKCRDKLTAAEEETKELRRATRQAPSLQAGVVRLETRLSEVGVESSESSTIKALHKELARLRNENTKLLAALEARDHRIGHLEYEARELRKDLQGAERFKDTIRMLSRENTQLRAERRRLRDQQDTVRRQSSELYRLNLALEVSETHNERLKVKLACHSARGIDADLRSKNLKIRELQGSNVHA